MKKIFILVTLTLLLITVASASEVSDDANSTLAPDNVVKDVATPTKSVDDSVKKDVKSNKIVKEEKKYKSDSKIYDVSDFDTLYSALTSYEYDDVTVNLQSDIDLGDNTTINEYIYTLSINGNNHTIDGGNLYQFIKINYDCVVTINNLNVVNCYSRYGSAIEKNEGTLTVNNSLFANNTASYGGAIDNYEGSMSIFNSRFIGNYAESGGAIRNLDYGYTTIITNNTFIDNEAKSGGAIIIGDSFINITDNLFVGNTATNYGDSIYDYDEYGESNLNSNTFIGTNGSNQIYSVPGMEYDNIIDVISEEGVNELVNYLYDNPDGLLYVNKTGLTTGITGLVVDVHGNPLTEDVNVSVVLDNEEIIDSVSSKNAVLTVNFTIPSIGGRHNMTFTVISNGKYEDKYFITSFIVPQNVFASPNGNGDGLTRDNPTNLTHALEIVENKQSIYLINSSESNIFNESYYISPDTVSESTKAFNLYGLGDNITFTNRLTILNVELNIVNLNFYGESSGITALNTSISIEGCNFTGNKAQNGGRSWGDYTDELLSVGFSIDSQPRRDGGAIFVHDGKYTYIGYCNFINNSADDYGGAIDVDGDAEITDNFFVNNTATNGGAIYSHQTANITLNDFINNRATRSGGAIYNQKDIYSWYGDYDDDYDEDRLIVMNNTFINNTAESGGAIENMGRILKVLNNITDMGPIEGYLAGIANCTFRGNNASDGKTLKNHQSTTFSLDNTFFYDTSIEDEISDSYISTINGSQYTDYNTFISEKSAKTKLKMALDKTRVTINENVTITITLTDGEDNPITNAMIILNKNDTELLYPDTELLFLFESNAPNGIAKFVYNTNTTGKLNLTAMYNGNSIHDPAKAIQILTVDKINTTLTLNVSNEKPKANTKLVITATLADANNTKLANQNITLTINNKNYTIKTNTNGTATYNYTTTSTDKQINITATFKANSTHEKSSATKIIKTNSLGTKITVKLSNTTAKLNDTVTITTTLTDANNIKLANQKILLNIDNKNYTVTTNTNGQATQNYKATTPGIKTLTATYNGSDSYDANKTTATLTVKDVNGQKVNTKINLTTPDKVYTNDDITITAVLSDKYGSKLANQNITLIIDSENYNLKTNNNGVATQTYNTPNTGTKVITAKYNGNTVYNSSTANKSINVSQNPMSKYESYKKYNVTSFDELRSALTSNAYENVYINITSDIKVTMDNTTISQAIKNVHIEGNKKSIDANNHQFLGINSNNNVEINNTIIKNANYTIGAAIINDGKLNITNSEFKNNTAYRNGTSWSAIGTGFGGAITNRGNLNVANSNFTNNKVAYTTYACGGGAINNVENLTVTNCTFTNNSAPGGGAIRNTEKAVIKDSVFNNNNATNGGAIENEEGNLTISNSQFNANTASNGGAIRNNRDMTLTDNIFNNNKADSYGGAIASLESISIDAIGSLAHGGITTIKSNNFTNNKAERGGAIFSIRNETTIENNNFIKNNATEGAALYLRATAFSKIEDGETVYYYGGYNKVNNNKFINNTADNAPVMFSNATQVTFKNNTIKGNKIINQTKSISQKTILVGDNGKFVEDNLIEEMIYYYNMGIVNFDYMLTEMINEYIDSKNAFIRNNPGYVVVNDNETIYSGTHIYINDTESGKSSLLSKENTFYYKNMINDTASNNVIDDFIKNNTILNEKTRITVNNVIANIGETTNITGKLLSDQTGIPNQPIKITVNNKAFNTTTSSNGDYNLKYNVTTVGKNNVTVTYAGNEYLLSSNNKTTFTVNKKSTKITLKASNTTPTVNSKVNITATLTDNNNKKLSNQKITLNINGKTYNITTNSNGVATQAYSPTSSGTQKITATFKGNSQYNPSNTTTNITAKKINTKLTLKASNTTPTVNDTLTITATLTDVNNKKLANQSIVINVENKNYTLKTNANGQVSQKHKLTKVANTTITAKYNGNTAYNASTNSTKITVRNKTQVNTKINTKLTLRASNTTPIVNTPMNITATLMDVNNKVLANQNITLKVNSESYNLKTNSKGVAILNYTPTKTGTQTITATYKQTSSYMNSTATTSINVKNKLNTKTTVSTVSGVIDNPMTFTAKVTDSNNKPVTNGYVIFKLNSITIKDNKKLTGSSNALKVYVTNGVASVNVTADLNMRYAQNLTAVYSGSSTYNASRSNNAKAQIRQRNASIVVSSNVKVIKQGQVLTLTARVYDTTTGKRSSTLIPFEDEFVYFKVNGITLKDNKGSMQKVKVVKGVATINYTIPLGLSGVTDGKTFNVKNHTILAGYYNKNYQAEVRNTSTFQVERSNITITISNATVNNDTHKLSLVATIRDYLGNKVLGPNKCVIKVNGATLKNGSNPIYYFAQDGVLTIKNITIPAYNKYNSIEIVTQDRLSYKSQRNTTTNIKKWVDGHYEGGTVVYGTEYVYASNGLLLVDSNGNPVTRQVSRVVGRRWVEGHLEDM